MSVQFSYDFLITSLTTSLGAVIGTTLKLMRYPPVSAARFFVQSFTAIFVGTLAGGVAHEYFGLGAWAMSSAAAAGAYISDEILRFFEMYGTRVRKGDLSIRPSRDQGEDHGA